MSTSYFKIKDRKMYTGGFSLIEVLVSLSIFTVVVTISVSALYVLIEANSRARNSQSVITNLSFALDSMTREIRTGSDYYCSNTYETLPVDGSGATNCANGAALAFNEGGQSLTGDTPNDSRRIGYRLNGTTLQRRLGNGDGSGGVDEVSDWIDVTSSEIIIDTLSFYVSGSDRTDDETPLVTVYVAGSSGDEEGTRTNFNVQTTIAQHLLDL